MEHFRPTKTRTATHNHSVIRQTHGDVTLTSPSMSARRTLLGDEACQQNTRNREHAADIGAKRPKICFILKVKSSRFQRFLRRVCQAGIDARGSHTRY
jgi:hypothetical protein